MDDEPGGASQKAANMTLNDLPSKARRRCLRLLKKVRREGCAFVRAGVERRDAGRLYRAGLIYLAVSKYRPWMPVPFAELELFNSAEDMRTRIQPGWRFPVLRAHRMISCNETG